MPSPFLSPGLLIGDWSKSGTRLYEDSLGIGDTMETDKWRVHRFSSSLVCTDLANAGKRGKKVEEFALYNLDLRTVPAADMTLEVLALVKKNGSVDSLRKLMGKFQEEGASVEVRQHRGVDVMPGGFKPLRIQTDNLSLEASYGGFSIQDRQDQNNMPTCIPSSKGGKKSIPAFYRWVKDNEDKIKRMTFRDVMKEMSAQGIDSHYFCAMD